MSTTQLSPLPMLRFVDGNGNALSGGKLFTYAAGTTSKLATYTDQSGNTPNTNPIILNSRGECSCWLTPSTLYKIVLSPSTDNDPPSNPIWTVDNISSGISLPVSPGQGGTNLFMGGTTTGSGTAQTLATVTPSNFTLVAGYRVSFIAGVTNTGALTLNVNSTGALAVKKRTPSGLASLTGNEIVQNECYTVEYDGTQYQLLDGANAVQGLSVGTSANDLLQLDTNGSASPSGSLLLDNATAGGVATSKYINGAGGSFGTDNAIAFNVPTGDGFEFDIDNSNILKMGAGVLQFAETAGGTLGNVWRDGIASASFGTPGSVEFPNGLILKWGIENVGGGPQTVTVSFTQAFPNAMYFGMAIPYGTLYALNNTLQIPLVNSFSTSSFQVIWPAAASGSTGQFAWFALGR